MTPFHRCPYCSSTRFVAGPRGGLSQNVTCTQCSAAFNIVLPYVIPIEEALLLDEIKPSTGLPADLTGAVYIIELL